MEATAPHAYLTVMEQRVATALLGAQSPKETARALGIRVSTVRTHIKHVHQKTGTHSPTALVLWALAHRACCVTRC